MSGRVWLEEEADRYWRRNRSGMKPREDLAIRFLEWVGVRPERVLEVGAANGWRLAAMHRKWGCRVVAVEPSRQAVEEGRKLFPFITFFHGLGEEMDFEGEFDLVVTHFVWHWLDPGQRFELARRVDRALREEGFLLVGDFGYPGFFKRPYHHREGLYTWKMDYGRWFEDSGRYLEIASLRYDYETRRIDPFVNPYEAARLWLLRKTDLHREEEG